MVTPILNVIHLAFRQQSQVPLCSMGEQAGILPWLDWGYFHTKNPIVVDPKGLTRLKIIKIIKIIKTEILFQAVVLITLFKLGKNIISHCIWSFKKKWYLSVNEISLGPLYSLGAPSLFESIYCIFYMWISTWNDNPLLLQTLLCTTLPFRKSIPREYNGASTIPG